MGCAGSSNDSGGENTKTGKSSDNELIGKAKFLSCPALSDVINPANNERWLLCAYAPQNYYGLVFAARRYKDGKILVKDVPDSEVAKEKADQGIALSYNLFFKAIQTEVSKAGKSTGAKVEFEEDLIRVECKIVIAGTNASKKPDCYRVALTPVETTNATLYKYFMEPIATHYGKKRADGWNLERLDAAKEKIYGEAEVTAITKTAALKTAKDSIEANTPKMIELREKYSLLKSKHEQLAARVSVMRQMARHGTTDPPVLHCPPLDMFGDVWKRDASSTAARNSTPPPEDTTDVFGEEVEPQQPASPKNDVSSGAGLSVVNPPIEPKDYDISPVHLMDADLSSAALLPRDAEPTEEVWTIAKAVGLAIRSTGSEGAEAVISPECAQSTKECGRALIEVTSHRDIPKFDPDAFNASCLGNGLALLGYCMMHIHASPEMLGGNDENLRNLLMHIQLYTSTENPFHNRHHALNVLHAVQCVLVAMAPSEAIPEKDRMALMLSTLVRYVNHPGYDDGYFEATGVASSHLATLYGRRAVLERQSFATLLHAVHKNPRTKLSIPEDVLETTGEALSHSSVTAHRPFMDNYKRRLLVKGRMFRSDVDRPLALALILKACDLVYLAKDDQTRMRWTSRLGDETKLEAKRIEAKSGGKEGGAASGASTSSSAAGNQVLTPRATLTPANGAAFYEQVVTPLVTCAGKTAPELQDLVNSIVAPSGQN